MRSLVPVLLLVVLLSGCVADEEEPEDPLFAVCPQWVQGPYPLEATATAENGTTVRLAPEQNGSLVAEHDGFPLDLYVLTVEAGGPVAVRAATTDGRDLLLRDTAAPEPDSRIRIEVEDRAEVALYLTAVAHGTPAEPSGVVLTLEPVGDGAPEVTVTGSPWYRVCGAVLPAEGR